MSQMQASLREDVLKRLRDEFPDLEVVELREVRDDRDRAFEEATALFRRHPDLAGIYNIGAGNSGIGRALVDLGDVAGAELCRWCDGRARQATRNRAHCG